MSSYGPCKNIKCVKRATCKRYTGDLGNSTHYINYKAMMVNDSCGYYTPKEKKDNGWKDVKFD